MNRGNVMATGLSVRAIRYAPWRVPRWLLLAASLLSAPAAAGLRVDVTTTTDEFGSGSGCALREALYAIHHATAFGGCTLTSNFVSNAIYVPAGNYAIERVPVNGNAEAGGSFKILADVGVYGAGADRTVVDGASIDSVFYVSPSAGHAVFISGMTVSGGLAPATSGAGIDQTSGALTLQKVLVTGNFGGYGIAASNPDAFTLRQSTVSDNRNTGVYISSNTGTTTHTTATIENTTISGNVSPTRPGGLWVYGGSSNAVDVTLSNSTIAYNVGQADGGFYNNAGGLLVGGSGPTVYLRNSILARNVLGYRWPADCVLGNNGQIVSQGYNLIETVCPMSGNTAADITGIDPQLAPLFDYGSGVPTHAVFPGSPARNAGNPATPGSGGSACVGVDARGADRTQDTPCDIGAYEYGYDWYVTSNADQNDTNPGDGICQAANGQCTLRAAIDEAGFAARFSTIELPPGHYTVTAPATNVSNHGGAFLIFNGSGHAVTLHGAGADQTLIDGNQIDGVLATGGVVALHGVTLSRGIGGGFSNVPVNLAGNVLLDRSAVADNVGQGANAIQAGGPMLTIIDSSVIRNHTGASCFSLDGGGGGGLYVMNGAFVRLLNTTLSDNESCSPGGAIFNDGGNVALAFTTIAHNAATQDAVGGGVADGINGGVWRAAATIIADNHGAANAPADCAASIVLEGKTLIRDASHCTIGGQAGLLISNVDPLLSPLLPQGGTTPSVALLADSPLHGTLSQPTQCVDTSGHQILSDQRGMPRPTFGYDQSAYGGDCDLGADQGNSDAIFIDGFD